MNQNVTTQIKPQDVIFADFAKNWRKVISEEQELLLPTIALKDERAKQAWDPVVLSECVFSADAGGLVPQITLIWNEPVNVVSGPGIAVRQTYQAPPQTQASPQTQESPQTQQPPPPQPSPSGSPEAAGTRFDLAIHAQGFERNFYSSARSTDKQKRFALPSNSALVNQEAAVLSTGTALFPKLADFTVETVRDRDTNRELGKQTLILTDLSQGMSYTIRVSRRGGNQWNEQKEFVFLTPVCTRGF